jgi:hypothetical protein
VQISQQRDRAGPPINKKVVWLAKGYGSLQSAWRTLPGIEAVLNDSQGRVRWLAKGNAAGQADFIAGLFGITA